MQLQPEDHKIMVWGGGDLINQNYIQYAAIWQNPLSIAKPVFNYFSGKRLDLLGCPALQTGKISILMPIC